jgi:hypothetical protein
MSAAHAYRDLTGPGGRRGHSSALALKKVKEYRFRIARVNLPGP